MEKRSKPISTDQAQSTVLKLNNLLNAGCVIRCRNGSTIQKFFVEPCSSEMVVTALMQNFKSHRAMVSEKINILSVSPIAALGSKEAQVTLVNQLFDIIKQFNRDAVDRVNKKRTVSNHPFH